MTNLEEKVRILLDESGPALICTPDLLDVGQIERARVRQKIADWKEAKRVAEKLAREQLAQERANESRLNASRISTTRNRLAPRLSVIRSTPPPLLEKRLPRPSASAQKAVISRLLRPKIQVPAPAPSPAHTLVNPRSAELAKGLEPIASRYPKLLAAQQRRLAQLMEAKEQASVNTFTPRLCETSRVLAQKSDAKTRILLAESKFQKIVREIQMRDHCSFHPKTSITSIDPSTVVKRMMMDSADRQQRQRERELAKILEKIPKKTPSKHFSFERLYPSTTVAVDDITTSFDEYAKGRTGMRNMDNSFSSSNISLGTQSYSVWQDHSEQRLHSRRSDHSEQRLRNFDDSRQKDNFPTLRFSDVFTLTSS